MRSLAGLLGWSLGFTALVAAIPDCGGAVFNSDVGGSTDASVASGSGGAGRSSGTGGGHGGSASGNQSGSGGTGSDSGGRSGASTGTSSGTGSGSGSGASTGSSGSGSKSGASTGSSSGSNSGGGSGASTGSSGSGSKSGASTGSSSGTSSGSNSGAGTGGSSGSGAGCDASCGLSRACCNGKCVNLSNDPFNCGGCNVICGAGTYCNGACSPIPCGNDGGSCHMGETCCGTSCCTPGQLCCQGSGPVVTPDPTCFTPTASETTCPPGCSPLCVSDRNLKRDIEPVDDQAVLEGVSRMPVSSWSYKSDDPSVRHLGPMAQDFHAAFGLGDTDRAYDPIDAHGIAFSAIRALNERLQEQNARIERLERENRELRSRAACEP
jgi:hypothetical protein